MEQSDIFAILNRHVFENEKEYLIAKIADDSERFVGAFRSTTPALKLLQYSLQSREIRFGDALEEIIRRYIEECGYINLPRVIKLSSDKKLNIDQYFTTKDDDRYFIVEQKIRDDHDSTKKRGQIDNFKRKLEYLKSKHDTKLEGIMYFIDPTLQKNYNYYQEELSQLSNELNIPIHLLYNGELFQHLDGSTSKWDILQAALLKWREDVPSSVNIECDKPADIDQVYRVKASHWHKIVSNTALWSEGVIRCIFPTGTNLKQLNLYLRESPKKKIQVNKRTVTHLDISEQLIQRMEEYYDL